MAVDDGQVLKAAVEMVLADGTIAQNVFYFICNFVAGQVASDVLDAVETYVEDIYDEIDAYMDADITFNPMQVDKISFDATEGEWKVDTLLGVRTPGSVFTGATDQLPNQMAAVLVASTLRPLSRGRKFFPGFIDSAADGGDLVAGALTALGLALNHYLADETVSPSNSLSPGTPRAGVNAFLEFTTGAVNSIMGTQRRRKPGVGA